MVAVEMLNDKKIVEREDEFLLAEAAGIPEHHVLLLALLDGGKLEIPQDRILFGIFGRACAHGVGRSKDGILTNRFPTLQLSRCVCDWFTCGAGYSDCDGALEDLRPKRNSATTVRMSSHHVGWP